MSRSKNGLSFAETILWGYGFRKTSADSLFLNSGFTSGGGRGLGKESSACSSFCFGGGGAEIHKYIIYQTGIFHNRFYYGIMIKSKLYLQKNKNLLEKLHSARLEAGLTQIQAGKKLRKPQSYLSKVERGERKIEAIELADFAKIYKKSLDYFMK